MSPHHDKEDKFLISLSDMLDLFRKNKRTIIFCTLLMAFLGALYALSKPINYKTEGTFREKINKTTTAGGSLAQLLSSDVFSFGEDQEGFSILKSRKLMKNVIEKLNLQAILTQECDKEGILSRIKQNLKVEWALLRKSPYPVLKDLKCPIVAEEVHYTGEVPLFFEIYLHADEHYEVVDHLRNKIGEGHLNTPFKINQGSFTLMKASDLAKLPEKLTLTLSSLVDTARALIKDFEIEGHKNDKSILKLSFMHRNRHFGSTFINAVMESFQDYLRKKRDSLAATQLDYLRNKEEDSASKLAKLMQEHADFLSDDLSTAGFADSQKEIDFLAENEHKFKDRLLSNELEIKRLKNIQPNNYSYYDNFDYQAGNHLIINSILNEIRDLKQEQDSLEIALKASLSEDSLHLESVFNQQIDEIQTIRQYSAELETIIHTFQSGLDPDLESPLMHDSRFLIKSWFNKLDDLRKEDLESWQKAKENFSFYLENLERLFSVHQKILQDRLTHQQNPSGEYQGINLETAKMLYVDHCKHLLTIESEIRQNQFFIHQLEDPDFEMTALSFSMRDSVSLDMVNRAAAILFKLKDQSNQSTREQERLKEELNLQRSFLHLHLRQMGILMDLNRQLISEKILALQTISLELIRQKMTLLEKNLHDYVASRLENFNQERELIQQHLEQIRKEMARLPNRWVMEQLIEQQVDVNQLIVKEIAKMVESKNISYNLEVMQSAPIDHALPSVHPVSPGLPLYTLLGASLGAFLSFGFVLARSLSQGIQASVYNLRATGQHVSGVLSSLLDPLAKEPIQDQDLETLRRLHSYIDQAHVRQSLGSEAALLLLIEGRGPDYAPHLAHLLLKKGKKVLTIHLNFDCSSPSGQPALLQYLQGEVPFPTITTDDKGDHLAAGGISRFSIELLSSKLFQELIEKLKRKYDWILGVTYATPLCSEAESLIPLFSFAALSIRDEKLDDLLRFKGNPSFTFILTP